MKIHKRLLAGLLALILLLPTNPTSLVVQAEDKVQDTGNIGGLESEGPTQWADYSGQGPDPYPYNSYHICECCGYYF